MPECRTPPPGDTTAAEGTVSCSSHRKPFKERCCIPFTSARWRDPAQIPQYVGQLISVTLVLMRQGLCPAPSERKDNVPTTFKADRTCPCTPLLGSSPCSTELPAVPSGPVAITGEQRSALSLCSPAVGPEQPSDGGNCQVARAWDGLELQVQEREDSHLYHPFALRQLLLLLNAVLHTL